MQNQQCAARSHYWKYWTDVGIIISDMESKFVMQTSYLNIIWLVDVPQKPWFVQTYFSGAWHQFFIEAFQNFFYVLRVVYCCDAVEEMVSKIQCQF